MKYFYNLIIISILMTSCHVSKINKTNSAEVNFNLNWDFYLSQEDISFDEIKSDAYKKVNIPHDWVVEGSFDQSLGEDAKGTGYLPGKGYGYYSKTFDKPLEKDQVVYVLFDGVYNNATVSINGKKLGFHPYGYSPFYFDITSYLNKNGKDNLLTVKVDHSNFADSRWYTGAGIYREVSLITENKLHVPVWGTFVTSSQVSKEQATVQIDLSLENKFDKNKDVIVTTSFINAENDEVATISNNFVLNANKTLDTSQKATINHPDLWDTENAKLYTAVTTIQNNGEIVDRYTTVFGIRSILFDADKGFFLNGKNMKIKGVCLHHDAGLVGTAVPRGVWKRRLQILKDGGTNAIRVSHNPASKVLLELCDEMGFLVQDEFFDEWDNPKDKRYNQNERSVDAITRGYGEYFQDWAQKDLKNVVLSHRNHPSIFQWSIGNEIEWTYPRNAAATGFFGNMNWNGNYFWSEPPYSTEKIKEQLATLPKGKYDIGETAKKLSKWTKELDTTRPVTANLILPSVSHLSGYTDALDVIGYSYRRILYDYGHQNYPDKPIMGTENLAQYHEWKAVMERPFISGTFLWTGADYMGEIRDPWPVRVQPSGLLNTASFPRGSYYMMQSLWSEKPMIHIATQTMQKSLYKLDAHQNIVEKKPGKWEHALWKWQDVNEHWNYNKEETIAVEMYSNCEAIELFLNGTSLGKKNLTDFEDHIYKWAVPYQEGELIARGIKNGKEITSTLTTAKKATKIVLSADVESINANNEDVVHIIAQLVDDKGNPVKTDDQKITFTIDGNAKLLGVDSGWIKNIEKFQSNKSTTYNGKTLLIIQAKDTQEKVSITANANGLISDKITINIQ
ncbi:threonine synthase [Wenyingzhuangia fucanilytica]|uniref:Threonine synthase n=1 Tax=Wenyingzhuangia fucanilytica TaxID=1790137 RepID=A0A1B1Y2R1_9FLAO|nr:glycoside hydrolase family 2 TIM barrel-domain containing protein [Wenyingzhuangia fucanilytica]ANW95063.1 threonine synthase [Wenyingzhuangia fucanilytica]